jgi:hypothetical protein
MKLLIAFFCLVLPIFSFASFKKGNGGTAIHCPQAGTWQILDFYEATSVHGLTPELALLNSELGISLLSSRLTKISTNWSSAFQHHLLEFDQNTIWLQNMIPNL